MSKYINSSVAIRDICEWAPNLNNPKILVREDVISILESIPAADVRPVVKAHWYWDKDGMDWNIGAWRCSACKAMSPMWWNTDRGSPMHKSGHKFCPNCGAMMEES